jgi:hypothetical protein
MCSIRSTAGSEVTCTTSVPNTTTVVRKISRSRRGNGAPSALATGMDRATARETAPRGPHQASAARSGRDRPAVGPPRTGSRASSGVTTITQISREPTAASSTARTAATSCPIG